MLLFTVHCSLITAYSPEVKAALQDVKPVVALESTLIAHGMPYPQNVETALRLETIIRNQGAVPATIAILNCQLKVGLSIHEIDYLGQPTNTITKTSRRDIPYLVAHKLHGATTVAATMFIANKAGIRVFATGGIGGVHREVVDTLDVSADLQELARTSVAVVCAGAKSILDIGKTLEYLETQGVPVLGYKTDDFPGFYTRRTGFPPNYRVETVTELAQILKAKWDLGLEGGVVVAQAIPAEHALEENYIQQIIDEAQANAHAKHIKGKAITPFLLAEIKRLSGGRSLAANIELVCNNAQLAAQLALAYQQLME